jgi:hypothetical protein
MDNVITMDEQILNEAFFMPFGLYPVAELGNQKLYGSAKLNAKFVEAVSTTSAGAPITGKIAELVGKNKVIPCFVTKGMLGFLAWKIFMPIGYQSIKAFYTEETKKIYILLTNNASLMFGYANNFWMTLLLVHECQHMAAHKNPSGFNSMFSGELNNYYSWFLTHLFDLKKADQKLVSELVTELLDNYEVASTPDLIKRVKDFTTLRKILNNFQGESKLKRGHFDDLVELYRYAVLTLVTGKLFEDIHSYINPLRPIMKPLYLAYRDAFGMTGLNTLAIQELVFPSEVISIGSEKALLSKGQQSIKQLL